MKTSKLLKSTFDGACQGAVTGAAVGFLGGPVGFSSGLILGAITGGTQDLIPSPSAIVETIASKIPGEVAKKSSDLFNNACDAWDQATTNIPKTLLFGGMTLVALSVRVEQEREKYCSRTFEKPFFCRDNFRPY